MLTVRTTAETREEIGKEAARLAKPPEENWDSRKTEPGTPPALHELFQRIEREYREMPGLSLTLPQAERLWGLDRRTCEVALGKLIERSVLKRATNGTYVRGSTR